MGKSTISMAIFNCYVSSPEGKSCGCVFFFGSLMVGKPPIRQGGKEASGREAATVPGISGRCGGTWEDVVKMLEKVGGYQRPCDLLVDVEFVGFVMFRSFFPFFKV